jgi:hypothetical protein
MRDHADRERRPGHACIEDSSEKDRSGTDARQTHQESDQWPRRFHAITS